MHGDAPVGDLAGTALSMAEGVLLVELLATGEVTQQQVAGRLRLDKSRVSRLCSALERKHLLARQRDESNRRNRRIRITPSGAAAATRMRQTWHQRHERMLAAMTPDERRALLLGLGALARNSRRSIRTRRSGNRSPRNHDPAPCSCARHGPTGSNEGPRSDEHGWPLIDVGRAHLPQVQTSSAGLGAKRHCWEGRSAVGSRRA
jgi:DNA-binding MarR family transcriptional regulator